MYVLEVKEENLIVYLTINSNFGRQNDTCMTMQLVFTVYRKYTVGRYTYTVSSYADGIRKFIQFVKIINWKKKLKLYVTLRIVIE